MRKRVVIAPPPLCAAVRAAAVVEAHFQLGHVDPVVDRVADAVVARPGVGLLQAAGARHAVEQRDQRLAAQRENAKEHAARAAAGK